MQTIAGNIPNEQFAGLLRPLLIDSQTQGLLVAFVILLVIVWRSGWLVRVLVIGPMLATGCFMFWPELRRLAMSMPYWAQGLLLATLGLVVLRGALALLFGRGVADRTLSGLLFVLLVLPVLALVRAILGWPRIFRM